MPGKPSFKLTRFLLNGVPIVPDAVATRAVVSDAAPWICTLTFDGRVQVALEACPSKRQADVLAKACRKKRLADLCWEKVGGIQDQVVEEEVAADVAIPVEIDWGDAPQPPNAEPLVSVAQEPAPRAEPEAVAQVDHPAAESPPVGQQGVPDADDLALESEPAPAADEPASDESEVASVLQPVGNPLVERVIESAGGARHIGDFCWSTFRDVLVDPDTFRGLLVEHGWAGGVRKLRGMDDEQALRDALFDARRTLSISEGFLVRVARDDKDAFVIAVVREEKRLGVVQTIGAPVRAQQVADVTNLDLQTDAKIIFDHASRQVNTVGVNRVVDWMLGRVRQLRGKLRTGYVAWWWQNHVLQEVAAIPVRKGGGIYFVPGRYADRLRRAIALVRKLPGGSEVLAVPQFAVPEALDALRGPVQDQIGEELKLLQVEVDALLTGDGKKRTGLVQRRLGSVLDVQERLALYESVLAVELTDLRSLADRLRGAMQSALALVTTEENGNAG